MVGLIISIISLSITIFCMMLIFDLVLNLYGKIKKRVKNTFFEKNKKDVKKENSDTKCHSDISPACRTCAYRSECWFDLGILPDTKEVGENEN